jgi:hypothetical protein
MPEPLILPVLILLVLATAFAIFWCRRFIELMLLSDSDFPGKYDKTLWGVAFILMFFLAPFAFAFWKHAYLVMRAAEKASKDQGHHQI